MVLEIVNEQYSRVINEEKVGRGGAYYILLRDISEKGVLSRLGVKCHLFKAIICQKIILFLRSLVSSLLPLLCLLLGYENPGYELPNLIGVR